MAEFGAGPELAAQCRTAPTPDGWDAWYPDTDGPIPDALLKRAQAIVNDPSIPLGATESYPLPGVTALIRVEPSLWGHDTQGNPVQGCFRSGIIYLPSKTSVTPPTTTDGTGKVVGVLTAISLVVGIGATIVSMGGK